MARIDWRLWRAFAWTSRGWLARAVKRFEISLDAHHRANLSMGRLRSFGCDAVMSLGFGVQMSWPEGWRKFFVIKL